MGYVAVQYTKKGIKGICLCESTHELFLTDNPKHFFEFHTSKEARSAIEGAWKYGWKEKPFTNDLKVVKK